jgi:hypothetical protein
MSNPNELSHYIRLYENILEPEFCENLISKFNATQDRLIDFKYEDKRIFREINLVKNIEIFSDEIQYLVSKFMYVLNFYKQNCDVDKYNLFPNKYGFEELRMKKYEAGSGDSFPPHCDANKTTNCKRFLVFFAYLNDCEDGHTEFPILNLSAKPRRGSVLVFPPSWQYLHSGNRVESNDKYIVGSYLHFVEEDK